MLCLRCGEEGGVWLSWEHQCEQYACNKVVTASKVVSSHLYNKVDDNKVDGVSRILVLNI